MMASGSQWIPNETNSNWKNISKKAQHPGLGGKSKELYKLKGL